MCIYMTNHMSIHMENENRNRNKIDKKNGVKLIRMDKNN